MAKPAHAHRDLAYTRISSLAHPFFWKPFPAKRTLFSRKFSRNVGSLAIVITRTPPLRSGPAAAPAAPHARVLPPTRCAPDTP
eukprot:818429-Prymnesium_polylepis.1